MHDELYRWLVPRKLGNSPRIQIIKMMSMATPNGRSEYSKYMAHNTKGHYFYRKKKDSFSIFIAYRVRILLLALIRYVSNRCLEHQLHGIFSNIKIYGYVESGKNMKNRTTAINGVDKTSVHTYYFKFTSQSQPLQYTRRYPTVCQQAILSATTNKPT